MNRALEVWWGDEHVGQFVRDDGAVSFKYDAAWTGPAVSLSLPRSGAAPRAAARFLDNLLPDNGRVRARWAARFTTTTAAFDLLEHVGQDVAGALVLLPEGQSPTSTQQTVGPASDDELAWRIMSIKNDPDAWLVRDLEAQVRFSLAGTQGKFTAARVGNQWLWSTVAVPSTHIFKPGRPDLPQVEALEAATLDLARSVSVAAPEASVFEVLGQTSFLVERFDRDLSGPRAVRLHTEDLTQALGLPAADKYRVTALAALRLLRSRVGDEAAYGFVTQMAFNVLVGNVDAHAKNYSLLLGRDDVRLAPLYDSVPVGAWPGRFDGHLAMKVSGAETPHGVALGHWRKLARTAGLDQDRVTATVEGLARGVRDHGADTYRQFGVTGPQLEAVAATLDATTRAALTGRSRPRTKPGWRAPAPGTAPWTELPGRTDSSRRLSR